jgi:TRAP transporter TAXI family solute receptor
MRIVRGRLSGAGVAAIVAAVATAAPLAQSTGFAARKPVLAAACKVCPWGGAGEVVKAAVQPYGYDIQICYNCWQASNPRLVAGAGMPPRVQLPSYIKASDVPPPPNGPVDFGVTSVQNVWNAYHGNGAFSSDGPRPNLRLLANIQSPSYFIVAVKSSLGITDLGQLKQKRWPVRLLTGSGDSDTVLSYYGLTRQAIEQAGGHIGNGSVLDERQNFDVVIANGSLGNAPEFNVWYEVSQRNDLTYLQLPDDLLATLAKDPTVERGTIPNGLLRGIDHPIPTVVRTGIAVYGRADMPDDFAYTVAKALDEHQDLLQWAHLNFSYNVHTVWNALDIPLHPAAARYYRERRYTD